MVLKGEKRGDGGGLKIRLKKVENYLQYVFLKIKKCPTSLQKNLERKREKNTYLEVNILDRERSGSTKIL